MDTRFQKLQEQNQKAEQLFQRVASYDDEDMILNTQDFGLIVPSESFAKLSLDDKLKHLAAERAEILYSCIDIQSEISLAGENRTIALCIEKDRLVNVFNDVNIIEGLNKDITQQSTDMAIMATMSNSALIFAKAFAPNDLEKIERYTDKVLSMKKHYNDFSEKLDLKNYNYALAKDEIYTPSVNPVKRLALDIEEVKELNIMLAQMVQKRFENGIRSLYFWQEKLGGKPQTIKTGHDLFDQFCKPRHDWEYEVDIQTLMNDRVKILTTRAKAMGDYQELVSDIQHNNEQDGNHLAL